MIRGLLEKELRQHGFAFAFLLVLPMAAFVLVSRHEDLERASGGGFESVRFLLCAFTPLACLVLNQLLIGSEFRQKTQLFLEGLPLPRWRMLVVKFLLGAAVVGISLGAVLVFAWWKARGGEAMTPRFAALLAARAAGWTAFLYALTFAHAFLGRYRVFFGVLLFIGFVVCVNLDLSVSEFGPFALVDSRFAFERYVWPREALVVTLLLAGALVAFAFFLGLVRDATVATLLAEKMSSREKLFMTMFSLVILLVAGETSDRIKKRAPVLMPGASEAHRGVVRVLASAAVDAPTPEETAALQRTVRDIGEELDAFAAWLGCRSFPPVFIVHRRDVAGGALVNGALPHQQGVLVRVNLTAPEFRTDALLGWLVGRTLEAHSHGQLDREPNAWVLDGIEWWWPRSARGTQTAWTEETRALGAAAVRKDFAAQDLHRWLSVRRDLGRGNAQVLAGSGLAWLAERHGLAKLQAFLGDRLSHAQPYDARASLSDLLRPTRVRLAAATGQSEAAFAAGLREELRRRP